MNADLFGLEPPPRTAFRDIRDQRPSVAERKAELCLRLAGLCRKVPPCINSAGIEKTREFMAHLNMARKVLARKRASVQELQSAINQMEAIK